MNILPPAARATGPPYFVTAVVDHDRWDQQLLEVKKRDRVEVLRPVSTTDEYFWGRVENRVGLVPTSCVRDTDRVLPLGADNVNPWVSYPEAV